MFRQLGRKRRSGSRCSNVSPRSYQNELTRIVKTRLLIMENFSWFCRYLPLVPSSRVFIGVSVGNFPSLLNESVTREQGAGTPGPALLNINGSS